MRKNIPNLITCLNLLTGSIGIYFTLVQGKPMAIYFVLIGAFFDLLDGMVARLLNVSSEIGKQLDSLADLVTFGLLPSFYLLTLLQNATPLPWIAMMIAVFSAIRLARFNVDESQGNSFKGLPSPANAIMITSIALIPFDIGVNMMLAITILSCGLLISNIRLIALKFGSYSWVGNEPRWILIGCSLILIIVLKWTFIPFLVPTYIVVSLFSGVKKVKTQ